MAQSEIRIKGVSEKTHDEIKNIASHHGVTLSAFLKPKLVEMLKNYPEHMKATGYDKKG